MHGADVERPPLRRLLLDCHAYRPYLLIAAISVAVLGVSQLAVTWLVKRWIEGPLASGSREDLLWLLAEGVLLIVVGAAAVFVARVAIAGANQRLVEDLRNQALARWLTVHPATASRIPTGDLLARLLNDAGALATVLGTVIRRLCREAVVVVGAIVLLFVIDWRLATAVSVVAPVATWWLARLGRAIRSRGARAQEALGDLGALANEQVHGISTIKLFGGEAHEVSRFATRSAVVRREWIRAESLQGGLAAGMFIVTGAALAALLWFGTFRIRAGGLPDGALVAFLLYAGQVVEPVRRLSDAHALLQGLLASAARVYELIDWPGVEVTTGVGPAPTRVEGAVTYDRVGFTYEGRPPVLRDVSLHVEPGGRAAIVGGTGAGKTTLARLLVRLLDCSSGRVCLDRRPVETWPLHALRRHVCLVEQEPFLFSGTIADNVRYGSWHADDGQVEQALRLVGLWPLVSALPLRIGTPLSETGRQLSGGERQRLALARAIVRDPVVVILDEATSAIDSDTESGLFDALEPWLAGRTVLCIAHRLSTVRRFSRAIVLQDGAVVCDGPPRVLWDTCSTFIQLFGEQEQAARASGALPGIQG